MRNFVLSKATAFLPVLATCILLMACDAPAPFDAATGDPPRSAEPSGGAGAALRQALSQGTRSPDGEPLDIASLQQFYGARMYAPFWTENGEAQGDAARVRDLLLKAGEEGLTPDAYHARALAASPGTADERLRYEVLLTDGTLRYLHDMRLGRIKPNVVDEDIRLPAEPFDAAAALADAGTKRRVAEFVAAQAPMHREYAALKQALRRYRAIAAAGGWQTISGTEMNRSGASGLLSRLAAEDPSLSSSVASPVSSSGPSPSGASPMVDAAAALKAFQERHGLKPDGKLGPKTLEALNVPVSERIDQIVANMERWRWLPQQFESRYVAVNVADQTLVAVDAGREALRSKVVVGEPDKRTPIVKANATALTINPVWHVPPSIVEKEILPKLRSNPNYLAENNMTMTNGPNGKTVVTQGPGEKNALGRLKVEMPNPFDVYLHDTPVKSAFAADVRTLSHGCVRVEQIVPLANFALHGDADSGADDLGLLMGSNETKRIPLPQPLPIYILYWTVETDDRNDVAFLPDVYDRDRLIAMALRGEQMHARPTTEMGV